MKERATPRTRQATKALCSVTHPMNRNHSQICPSFMPIPAAISQRLTLCLSESRKIGIIPLARPDSKSQVIMEYGENGHPAFASILL